MMFLRKSRWQKRYKEKSFPWVTKRVDVNLQKILEEYNIPTGKVLEIGCGYGDNAKWLAKLGFDVTGIDISNEAINYAKKNAEKDNVKCDFFEWDFIKKPLNNKPFEFVFDRGCFHSRDFTWKRKLFVENVFSHLVDGGLWLSLIGSKDTRDSGSGPPQLSAMEIVKAVEGRFKILNLKATVFDSDQDEPKKAWSCMMQRR